MARNDKLGEIPLPEEWPYVREALQVAISMAAKVEETVRAVALALGPKIRDSDPRRVQLTPAHTQVLKLLETHFRLSHPDFWAVADVADRFGQVGKRLGKLRKESFRMVSDKVANGEAGRKGGDTFGYIVPDDERKVIYLNETYFSKGPRRTQAAPVPQRQAVPPGPRRIVVTSPGEEVHIMHSPPERAAVILHETVHLTYLTDGVVHEAKRQGEEVADGTSGYSQIRTYSQAARDAYAYDRFALAVYELKVETTEAKSSGTKAQRAGQ